MTNRRLPVLGVGFAAAGVLLMALGAAVGCGPGALSGQAAPWGVGPGGMMGFDGANFGSAPDPGSPGFVAGTTSAPRAVRIVASCARRYGWRPGYAPPIGASGMESHDPRARRSRLEVG